MEFRHGRREEYLGNSRKEEEEEEDVVSKQYYPSFASSSSCPQWAQQAEPAAAAAEEERREHMFEKVVTPSDVGKLNRLVIPKQHAEKYFPLDPAADEKGLLLSFEDGAGKPWRFRYSYWNSSQSYVITKGWSRFVKEKRLDTGDTVSFSRAAAAGSSPSRLFIDCSRRLRDPPSPAQSAAVVPTWGGGGYYLPPPASVYGLYFRYGDRPVVLDSVPVMAHVSAERKRVRLFGVNLDCSEPARADNKSQWLPPPSPLQWRLSAAPSSGRNELPWPPPPPKPPMDLDSPFREKEESGR